VESSTSLSRVLENASLVGSRIYLDRGKDSIHSHIIPRLYGLSGYMGERFIGISTEGDTSLVVVSSNGDLLNKALDIVSSTIAGSRVEKLDQAEVYRLVNEGRYKYSMLDYYLRVALREWLLKSGYKPRKIGRRTYWSKGDDVLYLLDTDVDSQTLKGYISVDIMFPSSTTLWGLLNGRSTASELNELIGTTVIVPYADGSGYGRIQGFIPQKVSSTLRLKDKELNLLEYWSKKGVQIDPDEEPIVAVELISPEPRSPGPLYYPPSLVRPLLPKNKPDPHTRFDRINAMIGALVKGFNIKGIRFENAKIHQKSRIDTVKDIKLKYGGVDEGTYASPLISMQKLGAKPLHGPITIPRLLLLLPNTLASEPSVISTVGRLIQVIYENYGFGAVMDVSIQYYEVYDDPETQKLAFSKKLSELLDNVKPTEALVVPVINYRYLFALAKQICSDKHFHARVVESGTISKIIELIDELRIRDEDKVKEFLSEIKEDKIEDESLKQLISLLSNIVFSIYVEFLLQSEIYEHRIPQKLTWALAEPADGNGSSIYIGYDVSRSPREKNEVAVAFVLYDSYGYMLNAVCRRIHGEKITRETLESLLLTLLGSGGVDQAVDRIVIYKDGGIRGWDEFNDIKQTFMGIGRKMGFKQLDVIGVIKRSNLRLFAKSGKGVMVNPQIGTWIKLWNIIRHGVHAERALIVSSKTPAGGTVKPVLLERYGVRDSNMSLDNVVTEYLRLCRLNYWNPLDGMNKLPLPLFMADKLAYLALRGVQIKTP